MERDGPMGQKIKNDGKNNMPAGCSFLNRLLMSPGKGV